MGVCEITIKQRENGKGAMVIGRDKSFVIATARRYARNNKMRIDDLFMVSDKYVLFVI